MRLLATIICCLLLELLVAQKMHQNSKMKAIIDFDKEHYFAQSTAGKWGFCDAEASLLVATNYDSLYPLHRVEFNKETYAFQYINSKFLIGRQGERYNLLDLKGHKKLDVASIMPRLMGDVVLVKDNGMWGLAKTSGALLVPVHCTAIAWYDDLLALKDKDKWVLFHPKQGKLLKDHRYDKITQLMPNIFPTPQIIHFLVQEKGLYGVINQEAEFVIPIEHDQLEELVSIENSGKEIKFLVQKKGKWGLLSDKNTVLIAQEYDSLAIKNSDQPFIIFQKAGKWGVLDINGKELMADCEKVVPIKELGLKQFKVYKAGKVGLFDGVEGLLMPIKYDQLDFGWLFYTCVKDNKTTYISNKTHQEVILPTHQQTDFFSFQYFKIQIADKWGILDFNGKTIVEPTYDFISPVAPTSNRVVVHQNKKQGVIDSLGKLILPTTYDDIQTIHLGRSTLHEELLFFVVTSNKKVGLLDNQGKILLPLVYDKLSYDIRLFEGYFDIEQAGKKGIIKWDGSVILKPIYDNFSKIRYNAGTLKKDGVWLVEQGSQKGLVEIKEDVATTILALSDYQKIGSITETKSIGSNFYLVEQNGLIGVYNTKEKQVVIPIQYQSIKSSLRQPKDWKNLKEAQQYVFVTKKDGATIYLDLSGNLYEGELEK